MATVIKWEDVEVATVQIPNKSSPYCNKEDMPRSATVLNI